MHSKAINVNQMAGHSNITPPPHSWRRWMPTGEVEAGEGEAELSCSVASSRWFALTMLSDCASEATEECEVLPGVCGFTTTALYD